MNKQIEAGKEKTLVMILKDIYGLIDEIPNISTLKLEQMKQAITQATSLAQLFLSVKGMPKKKEGIKFHSGRQNSELSAYSPIDNQKVGYNLCHDKFTAWLVSQVDTDRILQLIRDNRFWDNDGECNYLKEEELAIAIKTMILGGEK